MEVLDRRGCDVGVKISIGHFIDRIFGECRRYLINFFFLVLIFKSVL